MRPVPFPRSRPRADLHQCVTSLTLDLHGRLGYGGDTPRDTREAEESETKVISDSALQTSRAVRNAGLALVCAGATLVALLAMAIASERASAAWPRGAELVSKLPGEPPATNASLQPSISADGRYVAFLSRAADLDVAAPVGGIFRKDLSTGAVELVAKRLAAGCGVAGRPWISADGRFVAIETTEALVATDTNTARDVYVRDMSLAPGTAGAYELVSALNGGGDDATYASPTCANGARIPESARAISFDGRKVLFTTNVFTNLPNGGAGNTTARVQLYIRDLSADTTTLITRTIDDPLTPDTEPAGLPLVLEPDDESPLPKATISGDGSTVAWVGAEARQQTPFHAAESDTAGTGTELYYMWRRIADGPISPTRRVTGAVDLDAPGCVASNGSTDIGDNAPAVGESADACLGPLAQKEWDTHYCISLAPPGLDYSGRKVAYVTCAELRHPGPREEPYDPDGDEGPLPPVYPDYLPLTTYGDDAFITDMTPGVTKVAGTRELTHSAGNVNAADLAGARINRVELSASGDRLAMVTSRASFTLANPVPTGSLPTTKDRARGFVIDNLSTATTVDDTLEWVTRSHASDSGEDLDDGISDDIALDGTGDTLVFATLASDVFFGDGNGVSDVFATNGPAGPAFGPRVTIATPAQAQVLASENVSVNYTAIDATSVECSLDSAAAAPCDASPALYPGLTEGSHTIAITASDGSLSNTVIRSFSVNVPDPPVTPPVTPSPVVPGPPAAPVATLAIGKIAALPNGTAKVAITLSGTGAVKLLGTAKLPKKKKLAVQTAGTGTVTAGAAGVTMASFKLNSLAKKQLKAKGKLAVAVTVTYTPATGSPVQQKMTIVFKAKTKK